MEKQLGEAFSVSLNYDLEFLKAEAFNSASAHKHLCNNLLYKCSIDFLEEHSIYLQKLWLCKEIFGFLLFNPLQRVPQLEMGSLATEFITV